jgi:DNA-binding NarL/FixJ family response regulator
MHPGLPALLISGDTAPERLREASAAGLRLLHKPVPLDVLVQALRDELAAGGAG